MSYLAVVDLSVHVELLVLQAFFYKDEMKISCYCSMQVQGSHLAMKLDLVAFFLTSTLWVWVPFFDFALWQTSPLLTRVMLM